GVVVRARLAARLADFPGDIVCRALFRLLSAAPHAGIVHDHAGALSRQLQRDFPPDAAAGAGHYRRFPLEMHVRSPLVMSRRPQYTEWLRVICDPSYSKADSSHRYTQINTDTAREGGEYVSSVFICVYLWLEIIS